MYESITKIHLKNHRLLTSNMEKNFQDLASFKLNHKLTNENQKTKHLQKKKLLIGTLIHNVFEILHLLIYALHILKWE